MEFNINNDELKEILSYITDEPNFFNDNMRLLFKDEVLNYKEELCVDIDNIIPLIDLYDNNFLIYDITENIFGIMNIVDEFIFDKTTSIEKYLELLRK